MKPGSGRKWILIPTILGVLIAAAVAAGLYLNGFGIAAQGGAGGEEGDPNEAADKPGEEGSVENAGKTSEDEDSASDSDKKKEDEDGEKKDKKTPIPVNVASISTGSVSSYITSTANLVAENEVQVLAEAEGRVVELYVEEGDSVKRGQLLASLVRDDQEIALKKAELKAANASMIHERAVKALADDLLSREDFDRLMMEDEVAQQELAEAKWRLEKTAIRSPLTGYLTGRVIMVGHHCKLADHLFTVADFDPLVARIYLPEKDIFGLRKGQEVRITLKAHEETQFGGRIRQLSPVVDTATGTVKVTVEAVDPSRDVRPGAFVTIDIVQQTRDRAVLLPRDAVIRELREAYVFVAQGDVAQKRAVSLGLEDGDHVEALSGVEPGDQVIIAGQGGLKDGSLIKVLATKEASDLAVQVNPPTRG